MGSLLRRMGIAAVPQYRVRRKTFKYRNYYLDFAIPDKMIAIECDGQAFHSTPAQIRYDQRRQKELEDLGWTVLRFSGSEIVKDIKGCQEVITNLLKGK